MADEKNLAPNGNQGDIVIYQTDDGDTKIDVRFVDETVWLTQAQLCELYQASKSNVSEHIKHIFEEGELEENSVVRKFRTTAADGKQYNVTYYSLDMIISLGYRIKSKIATNFRRWATERLKEYMVKGFTMDDERLKNLGGGNYWKELLDRIRDIRSSEKVMYRQALDLYATSVDYDPKSSESVAFFKMVQNKLHYAAHGHTAAEVIYERADAEAVHGTDRILRRFPDGEGYRRCQELSDGGRTADIERRRLRIFRLCRGTGDAPPSHVHERLCGASGQRSFLHR